MSSIYSMSKDVIRRLHSNRWVVTPKSPDSSDNHPVATPPRLHLRRRNDHDAVGSARRAKEMADRHRLI